MTKMLKVEFPQLLFVNSDEHVGTSHHYPILDEGRTLNHKLFGYYHSMAANVDIKVYNNSGFLVNSKIVPLVYQLIMGSMKNNVWRVEW
jgi:hypothetical protein